MLVYICTPLALNYLIYYDFIYPFSHHRCLPSAACYPTDRCPRLFCGWYVAKKGQKKDNPTQRNGIKNCKTYFTAQ